MDENEFTWHAAFVPARGGAGERSIASVESLYMNNSERIEQGTYALLSFIRDHRRLTDSSEYVLTHGYRGLTKRGSCVRGRDMIDILRGFLTEAFYSSTEDYARRKRCGETEDEAKFEVKITNGRNDDFHLQVCQQVESHELVATHSLDFLPLRYPSDKRMGKMLRLRLRLSSEPEVTNE